MDDVHKSLEEYSPDKNHKILNALDDMTAAFA